MDLMTEGLRCRGLDSAGCWEGPGISLGMHPLVFIHVETRQQPVFNEDAS
jgi:asparagine synthetase B (glutamine-hydrolysing)